MARIHLLKLPNKIPPAIFSIVNRIPHKRTQLTFLFFSLNPQPFLTLIPFYSFPYLSINLSHYLSLSQTILLPSASLIFLVLFVQYLPSSILSKLLPPSLNIILNLSVYFFSFRFPPYEYPLRFLLVPSLPFSPLSVPLLSPPTTVTTKVSHYRSERTSTTDRSTHYESYTRRRNRSHHESLAP